jgi:hypothetical protein
MLRGSKQYKPLEVEQDAVPQEQLLAFFFVPFTTSHTGMTLAEH